MKNLHAFAVAQFLLFAVSDLFGTSDARATETLQECVVIGHSHKSPDFEGYLGEISMSGGGSNSRGGSGGSGGAGGGNAADTGNSETADSRIVTAKPRLTKKCGTLSNADGYVNMYDPCTQSNPNEPTIGVGYVVVFMDTRDPTSASLSIACCSKPRGCLPPARIENTQGPISAHSIQADYCDTKHRHLLGSPIDESDLN